MPEDGRSDGRGLQLKNRAAASGQSRLKRSKLPYNRGRAFEQQGCIEIDNLLVVRSVSNMRPYPHSCLVALQLRHRINLDLLYVDSGSKQQIHRSDQAAVLGPVGTVV